MGWIFRKSKGFGIFRITASRRGLSVRTGVPGAHVSVNTRGDVHESVGIPGSGLYFRSKVGQVGSGAGAGWHSEGVAAIHDVVDATGGTRALLDGQADVAQLPVVGLDPPAAELAKMAGIGRSDKGPWIRGIREAALQPTDDGYSVILIITREDNPRFFGRKDGDTPKGVVIGRLGKRDLPKWQDRFHGRPIKVAVYIDATPGYAQHAEVRFRPDLLDGEPDSGLTPAPELPTD